MRYVLVCANYCCFGLQAARRRSLCAGCANYQPPFFCLGFPSLYLPCGEWKETLDNLDPWWAVVAMQGGERRGPKISHCITADALRTTVWGDYWFTCCCSRDAMFIKTLSHHSTDISIACGNQIHEHFAHVVTLPITL